MKIFDEDFKSAIRRSIPSVVNAITKYAARVPLLTMTLSIRPILIRIGSFGMGILLQSSRGLIVEKD